MNGNDWIPELLPFDGEWKEVLDAIYNRFVKDLLQDRVSFRGRSVSVRKHPPSQGKGFGFWHCISDGKLEDDRVPDPERCKRIGWIKAIIENCDKSEVDYWTEKRGRQVDHILWYDEEFIVVLSERGTHADGGPDAYLLKTSYCTFLEHEKRKKRKARDAPK